jgi:hypothetical protein
MLDDCLRFSRDLDAFADCYQGHHGIIGTGLIVSPMGQLQLEVLTTDPTATQHALPSVWRGLPIIIRPTRRVIAYDELS